jgi:hypothetical protein
VKLVRRSDVEAGGTRRQDQVEVFVRFVRSPTGTWVAEADAPPARAEGASLGETRRLLATQLALRMGTASLAQATLVIDLPDEDPDGAPPEGDDDALAGDESDD